MLYRRLFALLLLGVGLAIGASSQAREDATALHLPLIVRHDMQIVWPVLETLEPAQAAPDTRVRVSGRGGYVIRDGGYDESSRSFQLFFDNQPVGQIMCYVNRCEGDIEVPASATPGEHQVLVEGGSRLALQVTP